MLAREIILKKSNLRNNILIVIFSVSVALAFSTLYEIFEWIMSVATNSGTDFVGMQGDIWDAQKDMLFALIGALTAMIFFKKIHDNSLKILANN